MMRHTPPGLDGRRPTWAEINLENLAHNFRVTKAEVGPSVSVMPAVKANAYGHGAVECARALEREGADWFGVALPEEGAELREAGIRVPILCLGGFWEGQEGLIISRGLTPVVFLEESLERLDAGARAAGKVVDYHLKVDTGMGRLGVQAGRLEGFLDAALGLENVRLDGVMTHFAAADDPDRSEFTNEQARLFAHAVEQVRRRGQAPKWIHQANSAAAHAYPHARGNLIRPGGIVYGIWRDSTNRAIRPLDWRPVLSLHTRVALLKTVPKGTPLGYGCTFTAGRESRIATLPIGYNDGLRRGLSNLGRVLVRGEFAPVVGRISMDLTMVDVSGVEGVGVGDEVVIIGRQGPREITCEEVAASLGTLSYEITCGISARVPRVYTRGGS
ncbi:MAG TPA: alanine racemase [Blastocatellia bacterium]|nr:alanine racemase [Blastocatellia bacterium]